MTTFKCHICDRTWYSTRQLKEEATDEAEIYDELAHHGIPDPPADDWATITIRSIEQFADYIQTRIDRKESPTFEATTFTLTCGRCSIEEWSRGSLPAWLVALGIPIDEEDWDTDVGFPEGGQ